MKVCGILLVLLLSFQAQGINYFRCDRSEDCVKAYGGCGRYFSVHRRYKELYEAKAHKGDRVASCLASTPLDKRYKFEGTPSCRQQKCLLVLPTIKKEKKPLKEN